MVNKYNNPRLFNTVLTGPGMTHPRNPHVVIGSDTKGFVQGDLMDANAIMETIDQKIDVDNLIDEEKLTTAVQTAVDSILGDVSESLDTLKEVEDKFEEVEDKIPTKLSQLENVAVTAPEIGDYLYEDFTWGKDSTNAIGICVGTPDMFPDGKARFCELQLSETTYKWSTEQVDTSLPNITNIANDTYDGWNNTDILINLGENKYPAAAHARSMFSHKGYLPTAGELQKCRINIKNLVIKSLNKFTWSSTEENKGRAWYLAWDIDWNNSQVKTMVFQTLSFVALDVPKYVTTTDLGFSIDEESDQTVMNKDVRVNRLSVDEDISTETIAGHTGNFDIINAYQQFCIYDQNDNAVTLTAEDFAQLKQLISNG